MTANGGHTEQMYHGLEFPARLVPDLNIAGKRPIQEEQETAQLTLSSQAVRGIVWDAKPRLRLPGTKRASQTATF